MITNTISWSLGLCRNKSLNSVEPPVPPHPPSDPNSFPSREHSVANRAFHLTCLLQVCKPLSHRRLTQFAFAVTSLFIIGIQSCFPPFSWTVNIPTHNLPLPMNRKLLLLFSLLLLAPAARPESVLFKNATIYPCLLYTS